jgi:RNA polymerase sigma-70 factor, ECF subfamily
MEDTGKFEARYLAFLETTSCLRPRLHRYCARMTGSITDGEDVVQGALFRAYRSLETWDETRPLAPLDVSHCTQSVHRFSAKPRCAGPGRSGGGAELRPTRAISFGPAIEHLVLNLPPKERACVLLKKVFEYSLEQIAELVEATVGGVKAALKRGRSKLESLQDQPATRRGSTPENKQFLQLYVDRFNHRDWDGLRELISADARLLVVDRYSGSVAAGG